MGTPDPNLKPKKIIDPKGDYYLYEKSKDPKDKIDAKVDALRPKLAIERWDNEVSFALELVDAQVGTAITSEDGSKVKWSKGGVSVEFYPIDPTIEDAFEFDTIFDKRPSSDRMTFNILSRNLEFWYQPTLTPTEIADGHNRPDRVVGSYAVFYKDCPPNFEGGKVYKVGKAFHLYRPQLIDDKGDTAWAVLNVNTVTNQLTIDLPTAWMNKAKYPVHVDPTFGFTGIGGTTWVSAAGDDLHGSQYAAGSIDFGDVTNIKLYTQNLNTGRTVKAVIADNLGYILTNGVGGSTGTIGAAGWYTSTFATKPEIINASFQLYRICNLSATWSYYDTLSNAGRYDLSNSYTTPTDPSDYVTDDKKNSIYATFVGRWAGSATLSGRSSITSTGLITKVATSTIKGKGSVTAAGLMTKIATATIQGKGAVTAAGVLTTSGAATIQGKGSITAAGALTTSGVATIQGTGGVTAAGIVTELAVATLEGTAEIAAAGLNEALAGATLEGTADLVVAGLNISLAVGTLEGTGDLSALGLNEALANALLEGTGDLDADGLVLVYGQSVLEGSGEVSAAGLLQIIANAVLEGTAALEADSLVTALAAATLTGSSALEAAGLPTVQAQAVLDGTSDTSARALVEVQASGVLTGTGDVVAGGEIETGGVSGSAVLRAGGIIEATGVLLILGSVNLQGKGSVGSQAVDTIFSFAILVGRSEIVAVGRVHGARDLMYLRVHRNRGWLGHKPESVEEEGH